MIINNDKYQMDESTLSAYGVLMKLTVRKFKRSDLGAYKCISKNSIGDAEGIVRLYGTFLLQSIREVKNTMSNANIMSKTEISRSCFHVSHFVAELTLPRRKSLDLDAEQQLSDAHLQDTLAGDQDGLVEDAAGEEGDAGAAASPEQEAAGAAQPTAGCPTATAAPSAALLLLALALCHWS